MAVRERVRSIKVDISEQTLPDAAMGNVSLTCIFCQLVLGSISSLRRHVRRKHTAPDGTLDCPTCSKTDTDYLRLSKQMKARHGKQTAKLNLTCTDCDIPFTSSLILARHMRKFHCQPACSFCGLKYTSMANLKRHIRNKHPNGEMSVFTCADCGWRDRLHPTYKKHKEQCQGPVCVICCRVYSTKKALFRHYRTKHPDYIPEWERSGCEDKATQTDSIPTPMEAGSVQGEYAYIYIYICLVKLEVK